MPPGDDIDWFVPLSGTEGAARVFVVPPAGAGPSAAAPLADAMPPDVEVWSVNLAGRQARNAEPPCTDLPALVTSLSSWLSRHADKPYALFGTCGGALLAYLTARRCAPRCLVVGSYAAPDVAIIPRRLHLYPADRFWAEILTQGGTPPEVVTHDELRPVFEPALRADFALYAQHHGEAHELPVPVVVLRGREDHSIGPGALLGWRRFSSRPLRMVEVPGGRWLIEEAAREVAGQVRAALLAVDAAVAVPAAVVPR